MGLYRHFCLSSCGLPSRVTSGQPNFGGAPGSGELEQRLALLEWIVIPLPTPTVQGLHAGGLQSAVVCLHHRHQQTDKPRLLFAPREPVVNHLAARHWLLRKSGRGSISVIAWSRKSLSNVMSAVTQACPCQGEGCGRHFFLDNAQVQEEHIRSHVS